MQRYVSMVIDSMLESLDLKFMFPARFDGTDKILNY